MLRLRKLTLSSLIAVVAVLTGCANIQPKMDAFEQQSKRLGVIYAQVNKIMPSEDWNYCNSSTSDSQSKNAICNKFDVNVVQVSWLSKGSTYRMLEAIPKSVMLEPGAIIVLDMNRTAPALCVCCVNRRNVIMSLGRQKQRIHGKLI